MKRSQITRIALAVILAATALLPCASLAQTGRERKKLGSLTNTSLQVRRFSGEFAEWGLYTDISSPRAVTFHWGSKQPGAARAFYQVSEENLTFDTKPETMKKALKTVPLGKLPAAGSVVQFDIDFAPYLTPPSKSKDCYVRVFTVDDQGNVVGPPSLSAKVSYSAVN